MIYFKITSLTNNLPKRHPNKGAALTIEYRDKYAQKTQQLFPSATLYLAAPSLPVNLHKLRMRGLVSIVEVSKNIFMKLTNPNDIKKVKSTIPELISDNIEPVQPISEPKKTYKKKTEGEE